MLILIFAVVSSHCTHWALRTSLAFILIISIFSLVHGLSLLLSLWALLLHLCQLRMLDMLSKGYGGGSQHLPIILFYKLPDLSSSSFTTLTNHIIIIKQIMQTSSIIHKAIIDFWIQLSINWHNINYLCFL